MHSLSIVIPAYNEEARLPATLDRILEWSASEPLTFREILIVDDGSRDGTAALIDRYTGRDPSVHLLRNPGNRGKGYSVRHGMLAAKGDWVLFSDADLSTPIEEARKLYDAVKAKQADIAIGSRALDRSLITVRQPAFREFSGRTFNFVMRTVTGLAFRDTQCGFKLYRRLAAQSVFSRQKLDGFSFDVEDLYIAKKLGLKTVEVPVRWANAEGTKVGAAQGLKSFRDLFEIRRLHDGLTGER